MMQSILDKYLCKSGRNSIQGSIPILAFFAVIIVQFRIQSKVLHESFLEIHILFKQMRYYVIEYFQFKASRVDYLLVLTTKIYFTLFNFGHPKILETYYMFCCIKNT